MTYPRPDRASGDDPSGQLGPPRWMRVLGVFLVIALIALFVILHLTGVLGAGTHQ